MAGVVVPVDAVDVGGGLNPVVGGGLMVLVVVGAVTLLFFFGASAPNAVNFPAADLLTAALRLSSSPSSSTGIALATGSCSGARRLLPVNLFWILVDSAVGGTYAAPKPRLCDGEGGAEKY